MDRARLKSTAFAGAFLGLPHWLPPVGFCPNRVLNPDPRLNFQLLFLCPISRRRSGPWQRPFHFPKCRLACRTCALLPGPSVRHDAYRDRRRQQNSLASLAIYDEWSWTALQQLWFRFGILICGPMICQWLIHIKEIGPTAFESSYHISPRDIMTALFDSVSNST
jgi:hypothetical protein